MGSSSFMHCCVIIDTLKFSDKPTRGIISAATPTFSLLDDILL